MFDCRQHIRYSLSWLFLAASVVYSLWFVFAGLGNVQDPLYWLNKYRTLEGGWMVAGTLLTGGAWVRLFGAELLPLRLLAWACVATAITLPYCCLLTRDERRNNIHWLAITFCLMGYGAFQEFSPGTLTVLLLSVLWVVSNQQSDIRYQISAILLGLAVAVRFPNILALLVLLPLWRKRSLWCVPLAALTAGVVYLLGYWLLTPAMADASMSTHGLGNMVAKLWNKGALLAGCMAGWFGVCTLGQYAARRLPERWQRWGLAACGAIAGALVAYYAYMVPAPKQWYNIHLTYIVSALCLVLGVWAYGSKTHPSSLGGTGWGCLLLLVATMGTDTAWLKLFPVVLCLLPVAAVRLSPAMRRYLWPVIACLTAVVIVRFVSNSVAKTDLRKADTVATVSPYKGIRVREVENRWMEHVVKDYDSIQQSAAGSQPLAAIAVGQQMHRMRALTGCAPAAYNEFWSNIFDSVYTAKYRQVIERDRPIVFCSYSPQFKTKKQYQDRYSAFEQMLREEGYSEIDRSKYRYMIYVPL
ncbi:MAG: hypothetical protein K6A36_04935 [Paludibacteraceae bacterium]|nr:hypothetical protein [Paludibacteraceae bacterium]